MRVINCTIGDNVATNQGGAIFSTGNRGPVNTAPELQQTMLVANSALFGNTARQGSLLYHAATGLADPGKEPIPPKFTDSAATEDGTTIMRTFNGAQPLPILELTCLDTAGFAGTSDYHLATGSPLIDSGNDLLAGMKDLDLLSRVVGAHVDIGAYEYQGAVGNAEPITITKTSNQSVRIVFTGKLQFSPSLSPPAWQIGEQFTEH